MWRSSEALANMAPMKIYGRDFLARTSDRPEQINKAATGGCGRLEESGDATEQASSKGRGLSDYDRTGGAEAAEDITVIEIDVRFRVVRNKSSTTCRGAISTKLLQRPSTRGGSSRPNKRRRERKEDRGA